MAETKSHYIIDDLIPAGANPQQIRMLREKILRDTKLGGGDGTSVDEAITIAGPRLLPVGVGLNEIRAIKIEELFCVTSVREGDIAKAQRRTQNDDGLVYDELDFELPDKHRYEVHFDVTQCLEPKDKALYPPEGLIAVVKMSTIVKEMRVQIVRALENGDIVVAGGDGLTRSTAIRFEGQPVNDITDVFLQKIWEAAFARGYQFVKQRMFQPHQSDKRYDIITLRPATSDPRAPMRNVHFDISDTFGK